MLPELYENPHRFAVMLRDWLTRQGKTSVEEITWHDILLTAGLAHFDLVPNSGYLLKAPGPDSWDPSEGKSDGELLAEMFVGQSEAEQSYIDEMGAVLDHVRGEPLPSPSGNLEQIRQTVEFLASEELAGRAPGSVGSGPSLAHDATLSDDSVPVVWYVGTRSRDDDVKPPGLSLRQPRHPRTVPPGEDLLRPGGWRRAGSFR